MKMMNASGCLKISHGAAGLVADYVTEIQASDQEEYRNDR